MALLFADTGGANYDTSTIGEFWPGLVNSPIVHSGLDAFCITGPTGWQVQAVMSSAVNNTVTVGSAVQMANTFPTPATIINFSVWGCSVLISNTGQVIVRSLSGLGSGTSPVGTFTFNTRQYVEFSSTTTASLQTLTAYINGISVVSFVQPIPGVSGPETLIEFGDTGNITAANSLQMGTMYINDSTGSFCNAPLGNTYMNLLLPDSEGRVDTWTPFGNSPNFACVNTVPPPGDATYNFSATVGNADCYGMQAPVGNLSGITGVVAMASMKIDVAGSRSASVGIGNGSSENYGSSTALTTTYKALRSNYSSNPFTSAGWLTTDIAGLQGAVKVTA